MSPTCGLFQIPKIRVFLRFSLVLVLFFKFLCFVLFFWGGFVHFGTEKHLLISIPFAKFHLFCLLFNQFQFYLFHSCSALFCKFMFFTPSLGVMGT